MKIHDATGELILINGLHPQESGSDYIFIVRLDDGSEAFEPFFPTHELVQIRQKLIDEEKVGGVNRTRFMSLGEVGDKLKVKYIEYKGQKILVDIQWDIKENPQIYDATGELIDINEIRPQDSGCDYTFKVRLNDGSEAIEPYDPPHELVKICKKLQDESKIVGTGRGHFLRFGRIGDKMKIKYIEYQDQKILVDMYWKDITWRSE